MTYCERTDPTSGERYVASSTRGRDLLINPFTNKETAFTDQEREALGLEGLLPRPVSTMDQQLARCYGHFLAKSNTLDQFIYLTGLHDRNETLFFRLVFDHIDEMMPIVYTPTVGEACQKFSHIYRRARGLYIGIDRKDRIRHALRNHHASDPSVIVVTDGERILGLGDQGADGMGIPIGKLSLYTLCAGLPPDTTLPILLDVGTDNQERLADPLYLGLRQRRVRGAAYQELVDEFVAAVQDVFPHALLQFEDFHKGNAILQLERFRDRLCCFNDDIQGTAAVAVAGVLSGLRLNRQTLAQQRVVIAGAGAAATGIADLLVAALGDEGVGLEDARRRIWLVDSRGLVLADRPDLEPFKARYGRAAADAASIGAVDPKRVSLAEVVTAVAPTVLLGTSATPGLFSKEIVEQMAASCDRPLIFPMSNPTSRSECTAQEAITWSNGRAVVATGSPFAPVEYGGRTFRIGQANNSFIFPGVGLGVWVGKVRRVTDTMFLDAARALASSVTEDDLAAVSLYPELRRIRDISHAVACAVIRRAVAEGHADEGMLVDLETTVRAAMWSPEYLPFRYDPTVTGGGATED